MTKFIKGEFVLVPNREQALKLRGASLNVYLAICAHADKDGQCFPSKTTIENVTGYSRDVVRTATNNLVALGLLTITSRQRPNGSDASNLYQIMIISVGRDLPTSPSGVLDKPPLTKPINSVDKSTVRKDETELLEIVKQVTKRNFRVLPRGTKKLLDTFSLVEIDGALRALAADDWHRPKLRELSLDYLLRPSTIDKFLAKAAPINPNKTPERRAQFIRYEAAMSQAFRDGADLEQWEKEHSINDF